MSRLQGCHRYCPNCWRVDWHDPLALQLPAWIALTVVTFGMYHLLQPIRCRTCGNIRPRNWTYRHVSGPAADVEEVEQTSSSPDRPGPPAGVG